MMIDADEIHMSGQRFSRIIRARRASRTLSGTHSLVSGSLSSHFPLLASEACTAGSLSEFIASPRVSEFTSGQARLAPVFLALGASAFLPSEARLFRLGFLRAQELTTREHRTTTKVVTIRTRSSLSIQLLIICEDIHGYE